MLTITIHNKIIPIYNQRESDNRADCVAIEATDLLDLFPG